MSEHTHEGHVHTHDAEEVLPGTPEERAAAYMRSAGGDDGPPVQDGTAVEMMVTFHEIRNEDGEPARFGAGVAAPSGYGGMTPVAHVEGLAVGALATLLDLLPLYATRRGLDPADAQPLGWARAELARTGADPFRTTTTLAAVACVASLVTSVGVEAALEQVGRLVRGEALA